MTVDPELAKRITEVEVERDLAQEQLNELERRLKHEQENFNLHTEHADKMHKIVVNEKEMIKEQNQKLNQFLSQLSTENEKLVGERDKHKKDAVLLQEQISILTERVAELDRAKRQTEREFQEKIDSLENSANNNPGYEEMEHLNRQLQDANGRLKISYSKLKTDYTQIVDDLR